MKVKCHSTDRNNLLPKQFHQGIYQTLLLQSKPKTVVYIYMEVFPADTWQKAPIWIWLLYLVTLLQMEKFRVQWFYTQIPFTITSNLPFKSLNSE